MIYTKEDYSQIYEQYVKVVYGFLLKKCHDRSVAEDLTQDTFLVALSKLDAYDGTCKINTWLCGIANRLLLNHFQQKQHLELNEDIEQPQVDWDAVGTLKFIHDLDEPYREVMYLRLSANLSFAQIGEIMEKNENWARVTFYRGKTKIKEAMKDEDTL
ncbi:RNA polymerase sigma factor [Amedibacillus sp. YH-ame6]